MVGGRKALRFHLGSAHNLLTDVKQPLDFSAHHFPNILGEEVETDPCLQIEFHGAS